MTVEQRLAGGVAMVIGDGRGPARAVADACAAAGAAVVVAEIDEDAARAVDAALARGPLRALVLAPVVEARSSLVDCSDELWEQALDAGLTGPFQWMRAAVPAMRDAGGGSIVVLASPGGLAPRRGSVTDAAATGALLNLCKQVAVEHAADHVRVNVVVPRGIDGATDAGLCDTVVFLLSGAAELLSGAVVPVDAELAAVRA